MTKIDDPVLRRFRVAVDEIYGPRIERVVLYGSRARGNAHPDSDYDIAVFLHEMPDRWSDMKKLSSISDDIFDESGELIHAMPYRAGSYNERTPLMHEVRKDGVDL